MAMQQKPFFRIVYRHGNGVFHIDERDESTGFCETCAFAKKVALLGHAELYSVERVVPVFGRSNEH